MNAWIETLNQTSATWFDVLLRASWQGALALAVIWLIARFASRLPAAHKVWLWRLAFLKLLAGLIWFSPVTLPVLPPPAPEVPVVTETIPVTFAQTEAAPDVPPSGRTIETTTPSSLHLHSWLLLAWCAALFICTLRVLGHWRGTQRLLRGSQPLSHATVEECVRALSERFRLKSAPSIIESPAVSSPVLVGIFRPRIILPRGLADSVSLSRLESMLAHELAHLRRKDLLWLWLFTLGETLFIFHPLVWLARREWNLATEAACDEMAIRLTRQTPRDYGEMLVDIVAATSRPSNTTPLIAVGIIENAHTLKRRLKLMITTRTRVASIGGIALISIATLALVPWKLTAQDADADVAKLKAENAKLRKELEAVRRDAEKMRADAEQMRKRTFEEHANNPLNEERELKRRFTSDSNPQEFEERRIMEKMQAQLEEMRAQFSDENPLVRRQEEKIERMRADSERRRMLALAEGQRENAFQRESAERNAQLARNAERQKRAVERARVEQQRALEKLRAELEELRTQFTETHPRVREVRAQLEKLEAEMETTKANRGFEDPSGPGKDPAMRERAMKRNEQQRALLQRELELVEREVEMTRKNVEAGVQSQAALLAAQRELLDVKLQIAGLSTNKDDARAVIGQQIEIANKMLKENKQLQEKGLVAVGSEIPLEREVLRLTRKLHELDAFEAHDRAP